MANRFPLIVDTSDENKIKELPNGDNLDLTGSGIVNASSIQTNGTLSAQTISVNGQTLSDVALSGSYNDLLNTPQQFSGNYNDLVNTPTIPTNTRLLTDVQNIEPNDGDVLIYNSVGGRYEPGTITAAADLSNNNLGELGDVVTIGDYSNKFLKYYSGAWRPSNITWSDIQNKPADLDEQTLSLVGNTLTISNGNSVDLSSITGNPFDQDLNTTDGVEFIGLSLTDGGLNSWNFATTDDGAGGVRLLMEPNGSTYNAIAGNNTPIDLGVSSANDGSGTLQWGSIYTSNTSVLELGLNIFDAGMYQTANIIALGGETPILTGMDMGGQINWAPSSLEQLIQSNVSGIGNFTLSSSTIDTDDSSAITITPAVVMSSDLTVENDLILRGDIITESTGIPEIYSSQDILLTPGSSNRVSMTTGMFRLARMTTTERDVVAAQDGDMVYNTTDNKFQGYANGAWVDLH